MHKPIFQEGYLAHDMPEHVTEYISKEHALVVKCRKRMIY